jgi:hypothetical protein
MPESWNKDVRGTQVPPLINSDADTIRCVAGPGSGKTFGLVRRVERILHPDGLATDGKDVSSWRSTASSLASSARTSTPA